MIGTCEIADCNRPAVATVPPLGAMCGTHYQRHRRGRPLEPPIRSPRELCRLWVRAERALLDRAQARAAVEGIPLAEGIRRAIAAWVSATRPR